MPFFNSDELDDPLSYEVCPTWSGGQVSFVRANRLEETQSALIDNCTIDLTGLLMKRRGTRNLAEGFVSGVAAKRVQAVFWWVTATEESLIAFSNTKAYEFISGAYALLFDASVNDPDEAISVVQLADDLYWTDSSDTGIRKWNGTTVSTVATSPVATILESFTNRLIASGADATPDTLHFSDILNSAVWNVNNKVRIGADGDSITAVKGWQDSIVVVFKEHSTWVVDATPTLTVANMSVKNVHHSVGCLAKRSIAQVGQDLWFLSRSGIQSVQRQFATSNNVIAGPYLPADPQRHQFDKLGLRLQGCRGLLQQSLSPGHTHRKLDRAQHHCRLFLPDPELGHLERGVRGDQLLRATDLGAHAPGLRKLRWAVERVSRQRG